jgi:hypothetical protein
LPEHLYATVLVESDAYSGWGDILYEHRIGKIIFLDKPFLFAIVISKFNKLGGAIYEYDTQCSR